MRAPGSTGLGGNATDKTTGNKNNASARAKLKGGAIKTVQVAVLKRQKGLTPLKAKSCLWLTAKGKFKKVKPTGNTCSKPIWLKAKLGKTRKGKTPWSYRFKQKLGKGKYVAYARSTNAAGVTESVFKPSLGNEKAFRVK